MCRYPIYILPSEKRARTVALTKYLESFRGRDHRILALLKRIALKRRKKCFQLIAQLSIAVSPARLEGHFISDVSFATILPNKRRASKLPLVSIVVKLVM